MLASQPVQPVMFIARPPRARPLVHAQSVTIFLCSAGPICVLEDNRVGDENADASSSFVKALLAPTSCFTATAQSVLVHLRARPRAFLQALTCKGA